MKTIIFFAGHFFPVHVDQLVPLDLPWAAESGKKATCLPGSWGCKDEADLSDHTVYGRPAACTLFDQQLFHQASLKLILHSASSSHASYRGLGAYGTINHPGVGWSENEKKIDPDIGSEKKNLAKIFEKIKNPTIDFPP